jgi:hypothetical protein
VKIEPCSIAVAERIADHERMRPATVFEQMNEDREPRRLEDHFRKGVHWGTFAQNCVSRFSLMAAGRLLFPMGISSFARFVNRRASRKYKLSPF